MDGQTPHDGIGHAMHSIARQTSAAILKWLNIQRCCKLIYQLPVKQNQPESVVLFSRAQGGVMAHTGLPLSTSGHTQQIDHTGDDSFQSFNK